MYADRFAQPGGIKPGSLIVAIGINAALVGGLVFASPQVARILKDPPLIVKMLPIPKTPDPIPLDPKPQVNQKTSPLPEPIDTSHAIKPATEAPFVLPPLPPLPPGTLGGNGTGGVEIIDLPKPPPILTEAMVDPRFASAFQPDYPPGERRAERSGTVTLRVLIGIDGRVKQAERIDAETDAFWRVTERQALTKWRFRPATRDGVAVEAWRTMKVRFEMEG